MTTNLWQGERIRLRGVEPEDWQVFMDWNLDTETARACYFIPFPQSAADVKRYAEQTALQRGENDSYTLLMALADGSVVGSINTHDAFRRYGTFSYGVAVKREYWGNGYAGEAIRLVLRYFFDELGYQKCNAGVYSFNTASIRLHEKLGFTLEGRQRRNVFTNGEYFDNLLFGMTAEEFRARWKE
ncbi:MAG: GNAT family N-acetyltransferase [Anaerolineae bacterium]|nr:GNAT family N-acetyltransferase [Anaerolineae bacterium]